MEIFEQLATQYDWAKQGVSHYSYTNLESIELSIRKMDNGRDISIWVSDRSDGYSIALTIESPKDFLALKNFLVGQQYALRRANIQNFCQELSNKFANVFIHDDNGKRLLNISSI